MKKYISLFCFLALCLGLGFITGLATSDSMEIWYQKLQKPVWTPSANVFPVVWTILYIMIAISGWIVWQKLEGDFIHKLKSKQMKMYSIQLFLNIIWSFIFFNLRSPWLAFIDICALLIFIFGTMFTFKRTSRTAAMMLIPYMLWVLNALGLNLAIAIMN